MVETSQTTNSRLAPMYRSEQQQQQQQQQQFEMHPPPQSFFPQEDSNRSSSSISKNKCRSGGSDILRLPQINMLKEPPAPLSAGIRTPVAHSGFRHESSSGGGEEQSGAGRSYGRRRSSNERRQPVRSPAPAAGTGHSSRSSGHTAASIAAHTAAAQRSVANSGQPKFVVMTGPAIENSSGSASSSNCGSWDGGLFGPRSPTRGAAGGRHHSPLSTITTTVMTQNQTQFKKTAAHCKTASSVAAAKAAAAKAEMLSNVSYTIDKADGTSMTFSRRSVFETFDISPAALQATATATATAATSTPSAASPPSLTTATAATAASSSSSSSSRTKLAGCHVVFRASPPRPPAAPPTTPAAFSQPHPSSQRSHTAMTAYTPAACSPTLPFFAPSAIAAASASPLHSQRALLPPLLPPPPPPPPSSSSPSLPPQSHFSSHPMLRLAVPLAPPPSAGAQLQALQQPPGDESLVLPPITNHGPALADTPHILTLQPASQVGPITSLSRPSLVTRPAGVVFPLVVPAAQSPPQSCPGGGVGGVYQALPPAGVPSGISSGIPVEAPPEVMPLDRRGSVNLMSVPAGIAALEQDRGETKQFLLPDHEPRIKTYPGRTSYGFQMETFQRTSRKQYQQQRHRMHQQRYRQRQQLQQQQKRLQQVQQHQEEQKRLHEEQEKQKQQQQQVQQQETQELAGAVGQPQPQPQPQPHPQPQHHLQPLQHQHQQQLQPNLPSHPPQLQLPDDAGQHPRFFARSALPPQLLGGEVALDDMPQVHIVRVCAEQPFAPFQQQPPSPLLPRGNVPGFLLLPPANKDSAATIGAAKNLKMSSLSGDSQRTYVLVSAAEALRLNEELAAAVEGGCACGDLAALGNMLPEGGVEGSGDEAMTRAALCDMQRLACASLSPSSSSSPSLPNEYDEEITDRSITLSICLLVRRQQPGAQHSLDLREIHCTTDTSGLPGLSARSLSLSSSSPTSSPASPSATSASTSAICASTRASPACAAPLHLLNRVVTPNVVGGWLSASVAPSGRLEPGQRLEVPRLTIILSDGWSGWTVSCTAMPANTTAQDCLAGPETRDRLQPGHFDGRILPTASLKIVQRGICRHRHVDAAAAAAWPVRRRLVMTRVSRGMQDNQIVEERVFFLAGAADEVATTTTTTTTSLKMQTGMETETGQPCVLAVFSTAYFLQVGRRMTE